ncbi:MAG: methylenetetrahydrofolate reductase [NAD(P)H] [Brevinematia bacterium]
MKISEILKKERTISFEFFPPKTENGFAELLDNIKSLEKINPSFVSVTYGAGGSTREKTRELVIKLAGENNLTVMAHLTCISHSSEELISILDDYKDNRIENILALRGDLPVKGNVLGIYHSSDLIRLIKENYDDYFSIGGAVYPERHPESENWDDEMRFLGIKVEAGMEFGITQLFFDNSAFYDFLDRCEKYSIYIPIVAGIMPITNYNQITKFTSMCNAKIPSQLKNLLEKHRDSDEDVEKIGIEYAIHQTEDLLKNGVAGIHFYTLNKSKATLIIFKEIESLLFD